MSSWDTRASSVALEYRHGFMKGGGFNDVGYVAAFSSTTGKLSAQFGLHYVNLAEESETTVHGISGTATALFSLPLTQRLDNGLAKAALGLYFGSAPTIMSSGARNFLSIPLVLGVGVPLTPARAITITPWGELSPGVNLDTQINSFQFSEDEARDLVDPVTNEVKLTEAQVEAIVSDSVELDASATGGLRGGIDLALHVSNAVDFEVNVTLSSLGSALLGPTVTYVGGGIVYRWDDIVPAVLPAEKRLLKEDCDAIEERFRTCPNSRRWQPPRDLTIEPQPAPPPQPAPAAPPPRPPTSTAPPAAAPPPAPAAPPPIPAPAPAPPAAAPAPTPAPAPAPPSTKAFPP